MGLSLREEQQKASGDCESFSQGQGAVVQGAIFALFVVAFCSSLHGLNVCALRETNVGLESFYFRLWAS